MKICIVTWLGTGNFGTSLQSYALHKKLQEMGYDVCLLHYFNPSDFTLPGKTKRIYRYLKLWAKNIINLICLRTKNRRKIRLFNKHNYNIRSVSNQQLYKRLLQDIDVFITGSDQIWNCYNSYKPFYFLSFAGNVKRVAYASSMGTTAFPKDKESEIKTLLSKFNHIGVREKNSASLIGNLLNRTDVRQVVDPTFLLDEKHWQSFAEKAKIEFKVPEHYILCYFVGNESCTERQLEDIKQQLKINNVIIIPSLENTDIHFPNALIYPNAGPYEFVYLISHAAYVCTDSFHATAISINMEKDFIEFLRFSDDDKKSQNSRIYDVLQHYGLMNRLYNYHDATLFNSIDYKEVTKTVRTDREDCLIYLKNSIEQ